MPELRPFRFLIPMNMKMLCKQLLPALCFTFGFLIQPVNAGVFTPPEGCTAWLTVQSLSCRVSHHYKCESDPPGDSWRVDYGVNGAYFRSRIDYETRWLESHSSDGSIRYLDPDPKDSASFSELLSTGYDSFDFSTTSNDGRHRIVTGYQRLTGHSIVVSGVTLLRIKHDTTAVAGDGTFLWRSQGSQYLHPEWRIYFSGPGQADRGNGFIPRDFSPADLIMPGEDGFLSTTPLYDCEERTALLWDRLDDQNISALKEINDANH